MKQIKLKLLAQEKAYLKEAGMRIGQLQELAIDEIENILKTSFTRAREINALIVFQKIPTIGIRFAEDLVFLGYFSVKELKEKNGAKLFEEYEMKKGYWVDPCVEDQFRLVVHFAKTQDNTKKWWDFTTERKAYRQKNAYPANRPKTAWHELLKKETK